MAIDATDVKAQFGTYYINSGQSIKDVMKRIYRPSKTLELFGKFPTTNTKVQKTDARLSTILQPFQKAFTPKGTIKFNPVEIQLYKNKIDIQDTPDDLEESWLGFLAGDSIDRKQWPFVRWYIEEHILPRREQDFELEEVYSGLYSAPTPGTAGAPGTAMNGIKYVINYWITNGRCVPVSSGAWNTDPVTFCTQVEDWVAASMPEELYSEILQLGWSEKLQKRYRKGKRLKYNMYYAQDTDLDKITDFDNVVMNALPSMTKVNAQKVFMTPKWNMLGPQKRASRNIQLENVDRTVKVYHDQWDGVGFVIPEYLFTNDLELTNAQLNPSSVAA